MTEERIHGYIKDLYDAGYDEKKLELAQLILSEYITIHGFIRKSIANTGLFVGGVSGVLEVVVLQGRITLKRLCEILAISKPTASLQIDKLVKDGLVNRITDPNDRRAILLEPTEKGVEIIESVLNTKISSLVNRLMELDEDESDELYEAFSSIRRILGDFDQNGN